MSKKIVVNIGNFEKYPEKFGKRLCKELGGLISNADNFNMFFISENCNGFVEELSDDLNVVAEIEKAVIRKVGLENYGREISEVVGEKDLVAYNPRYLNYAVGQIAIADAKTRLVACLSALGIDEIEVCEETLELHFIRKGSTIQPNGIRKVEQQDKDNPYCWQRLVLSPKKQVFQSLSLSAKPLNFGRSGAI